MINKYLLIDFGASFVKHCVFNKEKNNFSQEFRLTSPKNNDGIVSVRKLRQLFKYIVDNSDFDAVLICSQMHGFALERDGEFVSDYVSWMKQYPVKNKRDFSKINGIFPFDGIPVYNVPFFDIKNTTKVLSLVECLIKSNCVHNTLFCGSGFFDIKNNCVSQDITSQISNNLIFNKVVSGIEISGFVNKKPVFCGFGDFQTAVYGSDVKDGEISINMGTGSQVSFINKELNKKTENRSFFDCKMLNAITHIPAGVALNRFDKFFNGDFFDKAKDISLKDVERSNLSFELDLVGGTISNITDKNLNKKNVYASLIRCFAEQYVRTINVYFHEQVKGIVFSGGIPRNIPSVVRYIEKKTNKSVRINKITRISETLLGLAKIANTYPS